MQYNIEAETKATFRALLQALYGHFYGHFYGHLWVIFDAFLGQFWSSFQAVLYIYFIFQVQEGIIQNNWNKCNTTSKQKAKLKLKP